MKVREISKELQEKAVNELNEVPSRVSTDVDTIREWIFKQPYLTARTDDQWILNFLRASKFSLERTKEKFDNYYTIKTLLPEFFENRDPLNAVIQEILKVGLILPLPKTRDNAGPRILLYRWNQCDSSRISLNDIIKVFFMALDILLLEDDNFVISGVWMWIDFNVFPLSYMFQMTPTLMKKSFTCLQHGYPARTNEMHYTNTPTFFESIFNLLVSLASPKLKERMSLHSAQNNKEFYKHLPINYLPKEYGGENSSCDEIQAAWKEKFENYREWFLEDKNFGINEKLRPAKGRTHADIFGVEGSFRKLNVD